MIPAEIVMDADARRRLADRFGPEVAGWIDELPGLVERLAARWRLEVLAALPGGTSRTFDCRRDGARVVLKLSPDGELVRIEAAALRAWAATPYAVDLLDADIDAGALLLEGLEPGLALSEWPGGEPPLERVAGLLAGLRSFEASVAAERLPALRERIEFLHGLIRRRVLASPASSGVELVDRALAPALALAGEGPPLLVHGDLHAANVLDGGPARGLVAIDPRPCLGDPTLDAVDWALVGAGSIDEVERRIELLAGLVPGLDRDRLWRWCVPMAGWIAALDLRRGRRDAGTEVLLRLATGGPGSGR